MKRGFALPTVLIASTVMIFVLFASLAATTSISGGLKEQYYSKLAQEAAESGVLRARECLSENSFDIEWTTKSLHANTDCQGGDPCDDTGSCFIFEDGEVRTRFSVSTPTGSGNVSQIVKSTGTVEVMRSSGQQVWQTYSYTSLARLAIDLNFESVVFGYHQDGAYFSTITVDGSLRAVGDNEYGQLGVGSTTDTATPKQVLIPGGVEPQAVFASFLSIGRNTFIVGRDGNVYSAGQNDKGQLGDGTTTNRSTYVKFNLPAGEEGKHVAILGRATYVMTESNNIYSVGQCSYGLLGYGYTMPGCTYQTARHRVALPTPNESDRNTIPTTNFSVDAYTAVLRMDGGRVYAWGRGSGGELANGGTNSDVPVKIGCYGDWGCPRAVKAITDGASTYVLDETGKLMGSGRNSEGQLGDGTTTVRNSLVEFELPSSATGKIIDISSDQWYVSALTDTGEVWSAGTNDQGQLGDGTRTNRSTPVRFQLPSGVKAKSIWATSRGSANLFNQGYNNLYVIGTDGRVYGAGSNAYGQLGEDPSAMPRSATPVALPVINGVNIKAVQVQAGYGTVVILANNQRIYTLGNNSEGQLGDGTNNNSYTPKANKYTNVLPTTIY